ncbi:SusC/RagA family TonB-linked outer membrane protein [Flavobacterium sp. U410]
MRSKFKWIFTLLVALTMQFSFAQEKTVTGVVSDDLGPVAGASVVVKGTSNGTTTDFDGNYSIKAKKGDIIEVSYVGMKEEVAVGDSNVVNITLKAMQLDAVEVVGALGIKHKADEVTSSYTVVKNTEITQAANPNAVQALIGKVSGLQINTTSNSVNSQMRIVINGNRSLTGNNEALIVIDNAISTATVFQSLPPEIIESVNVIKGAQGAVLYGESGSNGVIVVTTKKGNGGGEDKMTITINSAVDFQQVSYLPVRQTRYGQGWDGYQVAIENGAWGPEANGQMVPVGLPQADGSVIMAPYTGDSDNIKKFFRTGTWYQNGVSLSAGSLEKGYATASINRQDRGFVVDGDNYKRTNFSFSAGKQVGKLTVQGNASYYNASQENTYGTAGGNSLYENLLMAASTVPVDAFANSGNEGRWNSFFSSPYWMRDNQREKQSTDFFNAGLSLKYDFNENINLVWNPNVQVTTRGKQSWTNAYNDPADLGASGGLQIRSEFFDWTRLDRSIYSDILLNFDYKLSEKFTLKANLGNNIRDVYFKMNQVGGQDLDVVGSFYNYDNILSPALASALTNDYTRWRTFSLFANVDLGFNDYLFLNIAGRNDWSSKLSKDNNSYFYPGAGLSFIPTKAFDLSGGVLNYAKVYGSYTGTGNSSAVGTYAIDPITSIPAGFPFGAISSYATQQNPTTPNIKPERNYTKDFGVSLGFFNNRLTLDGQYYYTTTKDLITRATASRTSGIQTAFMNIGELHNSGINIDLGYTPIKGKDGSFEWTGKANFMTYKTIVDKVTDDSDEVGILFASATLVNIYATKGEEYPLIKGTAYQRDDQGRVIVDPVSGNPLKTSDFVNLGVATPDFIIGLSNSFSYKGVKLTAVGDFRYGGKFFSETKYQLAWTGNLVESAENGRSGGFIFPNSVVDTNGDGVYESNTSVITGGTSYSSYINYWGTSSGYSGVAENFVLDGTAVKLREVALSYTLPEKLLKGTGLASATFGVNAKNVFMWLPKENKYYSDPETNYNDTGAAYQAAGYASTSQYPATRTYGFTLNLTF